MEGGPQLPTGRSGAALGSWTELDAPAQAFAGTARYSATFDSPSASAILSLGRVAQSARIRVNAKPLATLIQAPFEVRVDGLKPTGNTLEVEVTSVAANRIRDLDIKKTPWKTFHDINMVNIDYKPLDASQWPLEPCGLLGPATLTPLE